MECVSTLFGRQVGLEPTTHGTTIRYSNQLSYNRHVFVPKGRGKNTLFLDIRNKVGKKFRLSQTSCVKPICLFYTKL